MLLGLLSQVGVNGGVTMQPQVRAEVLVCQGQPCRARGAEAVLTEIEELAEVVGGCSVRASGCLGYCSQGPNALVRERSRGGRSNTVREEVQTQIRSLETSAKIVEQATGKTPCLEDPEIRERFASLRAARARQHSRSVYHWNAALRGLAQQAAIQPLLRFELKELRAKAGFSNGVCSTMPSSIEHYTQWSLEEVTPVSTHSAVFRFASSDKKRGTPHPRGRGVRPDMITWHTTLLAEIGPNSEGPLPWVEREYTPISSAKDWEAGRCELLVKVYPGGAASGWLHHAASEGESRRFWLSQPVKTLSVPSLVAEGSSFQPASVLLILAGTGVVALPQVLAHRDPLQKLGVPTHKRDQLLVPIDLVLSCREDDVLLLPQIAEWCRAGSQAGLRHCTLLLTAASSGTAPFPEGPSGQDLADKALHGLPNVRLIRSRLTSAVVAEAARRMPQPCRVVVSGPDGFSCAAREMLSGLLDDEAVTILSA